MRYVIEEAAPRHWTWSLWWADRRVADAQATYATEAEAQRATEQFSLAVARAKIRGRVGGRRKSPQRRIARGYEQSAATGTYGKTQAR